MGYEGRAREYAGDYKTTSGEKAITYALLAVARRLEILESILKTIDQ